MQSVGAVESQVELLRSNEIALQVIKTLDLGDNPMFVGRSGQGMTKIILSKIFPSYYSKSPSEADRQNSALKVFNDNLTVERLGATYAIDISFQATDPDLAAEVANGVADAYINLQRSSGNEAARRASSWLEERIPEFRAKSESAQRAVVEYKQAHNIVETTTGALIEDQRVADLNLRLAAAKDETLRAKAKVDQFAELNGSNLLSALSTGSTGNSVVSDSLEKLRGQYFELASKLAQSASLGVNNPAIVSLRNQEVQLRSAITEELQLLRQASESEFSAAQRREAALKGDFDAAVAQAHGAREAQVKLQELQASAHAYQDLYATYVSCYNASLQQALSPIAEASVITPASSVIPRNYKKSISNCRALPSCWPRAWVRCCFVTRIGCRSRLHYKQDGSVAVAHLLHRSPAEGAGEKANWEAPEKSARRRRFENPHARRPRNRLDGRRASVLPILRGRAVDQICDRLREQVSVDPGDWIHLGACQRRKIHGRAGRRSNDRKQRRVCGPC